MLGICAGLSRVAFEMILGLERSLGGRSRTIGSLWDCRNQYCCTSWSRVTDLYYNKGNVCAISIDDSSATGCMGGARCSDSTRVDVANGSRAKIL